MSIQEQYENAHKFIYNDKAKVVKWFYKWQEVTVNEISMELPTSQDEEGNIIEAIPTVYRCVLMEEDTKIARNIDARDLEPIK